MVLFLFGFEKTFCYLKYAVQREMLYTEESVCKTKWALHVSLTLRVLCRRVTVVGYDSTWPATAAVHTPQRRHCLAILAPRECRSGRQTGPVGWHPPCQRWHACCIAKVGATYSLCADLNPGFGRSWGIYDSILKLNKASLTFIVINTWL